MNYRQPLRCIAGRFGKCGGTCCGAQLATQMAENTLNVRKPRKSK
jgi:hypothetical protein